MCFSSRKTARSIRTPRVGHTAAFDFDPATKTYSPDKTGTVTCGFACHTAVAKKDYIFTAYGTR